MNISKFTNLFFFNSRSSPFFIAFAIVKALGFFFFPFLGIDFRSILSCRQKSKISDDIFWSLNQTYHIFFPNFIIPAIESCSCSKRKYCCCGKTIFAFDIVYDFSKSFETSPSSSPLEPVPNLFCSQIPFNGKEAFVGFPFLSIQDLSY